MSSKLFIKKFFAVLLTVLFVASSCVMGLSAGVAADKITFTFDDANNVFTVNFPASTIAKIASTTDVTSEDLEAMLPDGMKEAYDKDGLIGLLTCDAISSVLSFVDVLKLIPSDVLKEVVPTSAEAKKMVDVEALAGNGNIDVEKLVANVSDATLLGCMKGQYTTRTAAMIVLKNAVDSKVPLSDVVDVDALLNAILATDNGVKDILESIDKSVINDVVNDMDPSIMTNAVKKLANKIIDAKEVKVNGTTVIANGSLDLDALESVVLSLIPRTKDVDALSASSTVLKSIVLNATFEDSTTFSFGVSVGFTGTSADFDSLKKNADHVISVFTSYVDTYKDGDVYHVTVKVPAKMSEYISAFLTSELISDDDKADLIEALGSTVDNFIDYVKTLTPAKVVELAKGIADTLDNSKLNKAYELLKKAYDKDVKNVQDALDAVVAVLTSVPDAYTCRSISDLFNGTDTFEQDMVLNINVKDALNKIGEKYSIIKKLAEKVSEGKKVTKNVVFTVNVSGLYEVKFVDTEKNTLLTTYLPEGTAYTDVTSLIPALYGELNFTNGDVAYTVPAKNTTVVISNTYAIHFVQFDGSVDTVYYQKGATSIVEPAITPILGYDAVWGSYDLNAAEDQTVELVLTSLNSGEYTLIFKYLDGTKKFVTYNLGDSVSDITVPKNHTMEGYILSWDKIRLGLGTYYTVKEIATPLDYSITFVQENGASTTIQYPYGTLYVSEPVIAPKTGYKASWGVYTLNVEKSITVYAVYTALDYTVTFVQENGNKTVVSYEYGAKSIQEPAVDEKFGFTGAWASYTLNTASDITVEAVYTRKTFKVIFTADNFTKEVEYTYGDTSIVEPEVPAKTGYTGTWASYELNKAESITVNATYTAKTYSVDFMADGKLVKTVEYTYGATSITAPEVPAKEGYTGSWGSYELNSAEKITVNAVYTEVAKQTNLTWLWIVLGVVGVGAVAAVVAVVAKKKKNS